MLKTLTFAIMKFGRAPFHSKRFNIGNSACIPVVAFAIEPAFAPASAPSRAEQRAPATDPAVSQSLAAA